MYIFQIAHSSLCYFEVKSSRSQTAPREGVLESLKSSQDSCFFSDRSCRSFKDTTI